MISPITSNTENLRARGVIKVKRVGNAQNRTCQTHCQSNLIRPTKVTIYIRDATKIRSIRKKYPIKLCAKLTENLLTIDYKSNIIKSKLDEDFLQPRIYFLTFIESMEMIFSSINKSLKYY